MATIAENLASILSAVYGSEVRDAIHDSIEKCYSDVSTSATLSDTAATEANAARDAANTATTEANTARDAANTAATNANAKADLANIAATDANTSATLANTARDAANTAATNANAKADLANAKATLADQKATLANTAATEANTARDAANTAATNANTARDAANTATTEANTARDAANTAATNANAKADLANAKATLADQKATLANTAATEANTARDAADTAATNANAKADLANTKASLADQKATLANTATTEANAARDAANTAATNANTAIDAATTSVAQAVSDCNTAIYDVGIASANATRAATRAEEASIEIEEMTVSSEDVGPTGNIDAIITEVNGHKNIHFKMKQGETGAPFIIKGDAYATLDALEAAVPSPVVGDQYNVGTQAPYSIYRWTGTQWEFQGTINLSISAIQDVDINTICDTEETINVGTEKKYLDILGLVHFFRVKIKTLLSSKVDKVTGKQLSTNDFTSAYVTKIGNLEDVTTALSSTKVDKVTGKQLSTNDFTSAYKNRVDQNATDIHNLMTRPPDVVSAGDVLFGDDGDTVQTILDEHTAAIVDLESMTASSIPTDEMGVNVQRALDAKLDKTGIAESAEKLETARTILTNLSSLSTASFDGSENISPGVTGTLGIANGGGGANTAAGIRNNLELKSGATREILTGTVLITRVSQGVASSTITFSTPFTDIPKIMANIQTAYPQNGSITINNISTTGATIYFYNITTSTSALPVDWVAIN